MAGIQGVNCGYQATPKFCGNGEKKASSPILKGTLIGAGVGATVSTGTFAYSASKGFNLGAKLMARGIAVGTINAAVIGLVIGAIVKLCSGNKNKA